MGIGQSGLSLLGENVRADRGMGFGQPGLFLLGKYVWEGTLGGGQSGLGDDLMGS